MREAAVVQIIEIYIVLAVLHDQPAMMLVGLAPLALVAAEAAWHMVDHTLLAMGRI